MKLLQPNEIIVLYIKSKDNMLSIYIFYIFTPIYNLNLWFYLYYRSDWSIIICKILKPGKVLSLTLANCQIVKTEKKQAQLGAYW